MPNQTIMNWHEQAGADPASPFYVSNDTDDNCGSAILTMAFSVITALEWDSERKEAIENQRRIEDLKLAADADDDTHYSSVTHPQRIKAINAGLSSPLYTSNCLECYSSSPLECLNNGYDEFIATPFNANLNAGDSAVTYARSGLAQAYHNDRVNDDALYYKSILDRANAIDKAKAAMWVDHTAKYKYISNASAIWNGLAASAASGYASSIRQFNFGLGLAGGYGGGIGGAV